MKKTDSLKTQPVFCLPVQEVQIGGWQIIRHAGGANETNFRFHRSVKLDGGQTVTVWASEAGVAHEPPANIVMKQQKWFVADNMRTVLLNADSVEVAAAERVRHTVSSHASRHRETSFDNNGAELQRQDRAGSSGSSVGVSWWLTKRNIFEIDLRIRLISISSFFVCSAFSRSGRRKCPIFCIAICHTNSHGTSFEQMPSFFCSFFFTHSLQNNEVSTNVFIVTQCTRNLFLL